VHREMAELASKCTSGGTFRRQLGHLTMHGLTNRTRDSTGIMTRLL